VRIFQKNRIRTLRILEPSYDRGWYTGSLPSFTISLVGLLEFVASQYNEDKHKTVYSHCCIHEKPTSTADCSAN